MPYISLYRKYRPQTFQDVVGQQIVVKTLKNSIINNKISHAYIFSGPRGTGKTSIAKIFSKAVNCKNNQNGDLCNNCDVCLSNFDDEIDIIEIDAASNNGVDEIREIRNNVKLLPSKLKYRVYIIDEVHMLSISAFNALLKTLEEPPEYCIFILATTEINKIPLTVISRCQKFDFKKINKKDIIERLKYITNNESKKLNDNIYELIADLSNGGLRDAINLLDQVLSINKDEITQTDVLDIVGDIDYNSIIKLLKYITNCDIKNSILEIDNYNNTGKNFLKIVELLENVIKDILIFNNTNEYYDKEYEDKLISFSKIDINDLIKVSNELFNLEYELKRNNNHKTIAEIYFIKMCLLFDNKTEEEKKLVIDNKLNINDNNGINTNNVDIDLKKIYINNSLFGANKQLKLDFTNKYGIINEYLTNKTYNSIANLLVKSSPEVVSENYVLITFKNSFEVVLFEKNIEESKKLLKKIYNKNYNIVAVTNDEWNDIKKEYINNIKNGVKYNYIDPNIDLIKNKNNNSSKLENNIENIFGDEYKIIE